MMRGRTKKYSTSLHDPETCPHPAEYCDGWDVETQLTPESDWATIAGGHFDKDAYSDASWYADFLNQMDFNGDTAREALAYDEARRLFEWKCDICHAYYVTDERLALHLVKGIDAYWTLCDDEAHRGRRVPTWDEVQTARVNVINDVHYGPVKPRHIELFEHPIRESWAKHDCYLIDEGGIKTDEGVAWVSGDDLVSLPLASWEMRMYPDRYTPDIQPDDWVVMFEHSVERETGNIYDAARYRYAARNWMGQEGVVDVRWPGDKRAVGFQLSRLSDEIFDALVGLDDYPVFSDDDLSEVETEVQDAAWDRYYKQDYLEELEKVALKRFTAAPWARSEDDIKEAVAERGEDISHRLRARAGEDWEIGGDGGWETWIDSQAMAQEVRYEDLWPPLPTDAQPELPGMPGPEIDEWQSTDELRLEDN